MNLAGKGAAGGGRYWNCWGKTGIVDFTRAVENVNIAN